MNESHTETLEVPGAVLMYDVRPADASGHPVLVIIGSPMAASGFVTLASHFADRTVVTYDPAGSSAAAGPMAWNRRSPRSGPTMSTGSSKLRESLR
jgi:hypothetical protein